MNENVRQDWFWSDVGTNMYTNTIYIAWFIMEKINFNYCLKKEEFPSSVTPSLLHKLRNLEVNII